MLIVVKDGDVELLLQTALDLETAGTGDIFQADAAESGRFVQANVVFHSCIYNNHFIIIHNFINPFTRGIWVLLAETRYHRLESKFRFEDGPSPLPLRRR